MTLLRWLTFLLRSQIVILTVLHFWIYLFLLALVFVLHHIASDYSCADWDVIHDHLRDIPWEDIFQLSASVAASKFCE